MSNILNRDQARRLVGPDLEQAVCKVYQQMTLGRKELTPKEVAVGLFSL